MSENSAFGSEASSARESPILSSQSSHTNMTSPEILSPSAVQPPDFHIIETKFDVLTGIVSHLHRGSNDQAEENKIFKNQFDNYSDYTNRKIENLSFQFNTRLSDMSKEFDTKLKNQSVEINTKLENNFVNLHGEMGKLTTAMEKQADYILDKLFPLKASFNDKPSPSSNVDTTHLDSSGPSVHEIHNQNKSNNQNLQNPENLTSGHVPSAFIPIENTKTTQVQIDKPINVASSPSISFNNHNSGNVGYTKPNSYDGKLNWSDYKVHYEIVAQLNGWSSEIKALKLISCMQNDALVEIGDINTNFHHLIVSFQTVDCHLESQIPSLFKISIDKQVTIPPNSETIIHALPNEKLPYGTTMILDNTSQSFKNKGVLAAKSICIFKGDNLPLRVMDMTDLPQTLYKNTCAGTAETVCSENILGNINAEPDLVLPEHNYASCD
ncbi:unnamed protein product [Mytilus coruscus]|uniref:Uncharacterized protein n=1 Tax=Mytilus coruscus TaxID=42192 RepID=A0A6J8DEC7_MYTCO|nr:unnamed protein product [Mytilus coruscus]